MLYFELQKTWDYQTSCIRLITKQVTGVYHYLFDMINIYNSLAMLYSPGYSVINFKSIVIA